MKTKSKKLNGVGVSPGIALGSALVFEKEKIIVPRYRASDIKLENDRFFNALEEVKNETFKIYNEALKEKGSHKADILSAYLMIIQDNRMITEVTRFINEKKFNAEAAVNDGMDIIVKIFEAIEDDYMKERAEDIVDIKNRLLCRLLKIKNTDISKLEKNSIIVCKDLSLSDITKMDTKNVAGIIASRGGKNSHACIIARDLEIPAVFNVPEALSEIRNNDKLSINANTGEIIINPDKFEILLQTSLYKKYICSKKELELYKDLKCETKDGKKIGLLTNISNLSEIEKSLKSSAQGVGLFRSEFLFVDKPTPPSEDEQFKIYKEALEKVGNNPMTIRTIDIGSDKNVSYIGSSFESNPALGYRGIRISLDKIDMFKSQIRALLRASYFGDLRILLPMISSFEELIKAKSIISEVKSELIENNIRFNDKIKIGIMIEVPSAAIISDILAKECDFFSIGTNDLIQYTMAADRNNFMVSALYSNYNPAVLRLIAMSVQSAHEANIPCSICGEAAIDPVLFPVLVGMGVDTFSMASSYILEIKKILLGIIFNDTLILAQEVLKLKDSQSVASHLMKFIK